MTKRAATPGLWFSRQEHHLWPITAEALWSPPPANSISPKKRDKKDAAASKAVIISNSQVWTPRGRPRWQQSCGRAAPVAALQMQSWSWRGPRSSTDRF